jgi:osmotically inducible lipoprotein OsmB
LEGSVRLVSLRAVVLSLTLGFAALSLSACGHSPLTRALTGGAIGAGAGAAVGAATGGNAGTGALVGGGIGAAGGALTAH